MKEARTRDEAMLNPIPGTLRPSLRTAEKAAPANERITEAIAKNMNLSQIIFLQFSKVLQCRGPEEHPF